ncbi:hypothetical protein ABVB25_40075, partial [Streptomyces anthocyanicus]
MHTEADGLDLRHHGDAEVRDDGAALVDLAVNVRAGTPPAWLREHVAASLGSLARALLALGLLLLLLLPAGAATHAGHP